MSSWRDVATALALVVCACLAWPDHCFAQTRAHIGPNSRESSHLYVLLGWGNNSPGLSEFAGRMRRRGIPTTVRNHGDWMELAQQAIQQYKSGRLRSIMIIGHSLGGSAAIEMAAQLGRSSIPVQLVVTLDPTGGSEVPANVRLSANFRPSGSEDHFSVIAAHDRDLSYYVLGGKRPRGVRALTQRAGR